MQERQVLMLRVQENDRLASSDVVQRCVSVNMHHCRLWTEVSGGFNGMSSF